jgi:dUTP pyrophosphatase
MGLRARAVDALLISAGIFRTALDQVSELRELLTGAPPQSHGEQAVADPWGAAVDGEPPEAELAPPLPPPPPPGARLVGALQLRFSRLGNEAILPERAHADDAGLDLFAAEAARIGPGERVSVGTGLAVAIPEGHAGLVLPRSGLALRQGIGLANAPGLIDPGYRGEIRVLLLNTDRSTECRVAKGDRIAQLLLVPVAAALPVEAAELEESARGSRGFGSSGH